MSVPIVRPTADFLPRKQNQRRDAGQHQNHHTERRRHSAAGGIRAWAVERSGQRKQSEERVRTGDDPK
jgi:hypothetical protein